MLNEIEIQNIELRAEIERLQDERAKREADFEPLLDEILRLREELRTCQETLTVCLETS